MNSNRIHSHQVISTLDSLDSGPSEAKVTATQRASIMTKLAENAGLSVPQDTLKAARTTGHAAAGTASRCVVLKNMFDRLCEDAQSNQNFFSELASEVRTEVAKMGTVLHCAADKWSNGFVYLKMFTDSDAARVMETMHGRQASRHTFFAHLSPAVALNSPPVTAVSAPSVTVYI